MHVKYIEVLQDDGGYKNSVLNFLTTLSFVKYVLCSSRPDSGLSFKTDQN